MVRATIGLLIGMATLASAVADRAAAAPCERPAGKALLDDAFKDPSQGWSLDATAKFSDSGLTLILNPPYNSYYYTNTVVNASDASYCLEAIVPTSFDDENRTAVGLLFLFENDKNYFALVMDGQGMLRIDRYVDGQRTVLYGPALQGRSNPGDVAALGVTVSGESIKAYLDTKLVSTLTASKPVGDLSFGAYVHKDKTPGPTLAFQFNRLIVMAPDK